MSAEPEIKLTRFQREEVSGLLDVCNDEWDHGKGDAEWEPWGSPEALMPRTLTRPASRAYNRGMTATENATPTPRLWADDNGSLTCEQHAGATLRSAIKARPRAKSHRTSLGVYELVNYDELAAMFAKAGLPKPACEDAPHGGPLTALRVAYGYTGRDMHAVPATDTRTLPTALCGQLAILGTGDYRTALTTGPKCPTCTAHTRSTR